MASIQSIRDGIATQLGLISGMNVYPDISDSMMVPAAVVGMPTGVVYDFAFRSPVARVTIPIRVYAGPVLEAEAQRVLDDCVSADGASSVRAAIDLDPQLSAVAQSCRVISAQAYGVYEIAGVNYLGVEFTVEVVA